jgi:hypothetical protein
MPHSLIRSSTYLLIQSVNASLTHALTHLLIQSVPHSLTHSPNLSLLTKSATPSPRLTRLLTSWCGAVTTVCSVLSVATSHRLHETTPFKMRHSQFLPHPLSTSVPLLVKHRRQVCLISGTLTPPSKSFADLLKLSNFSTLYSQNSCSVKLTTVLVFCVNDEVCFDPSAKLGFNPYPSNVENIVSS